jgi:signal transduction histidine kinase
MSHELRSPLNAVIGFSDLLLREANENDEITNRLVPKIRDSGKYLLKMIEELLDFDRIEAGKVHLNLEPASINDIVFRVVDSWRIRFPEGYSLTLQLDHACGVIGCDTTRISQILNNLIDNAVKYSPGGGTIRVCTTATPEEFQVSVQDQGMGITPEEKKIIFDRFRQLESGYKRRAGGLGIGLALARVLMECTGGVSGSKVMGKTEVPFRSPCLGSKSPHEWKVFKQRDPRRWRLMRTLGMAGRYWSWMMWITITST